MTYETYLFFQKLLNDKIINFKSNNLYSFYKSNNYYFKFFVSFVYFLILKEYIVKKNKKENTFEKKYTSNLFNDDLEKFFIENKEIIEIEKTLSNEYVFIIDTIRDSLLHGLFTLDINSKKVILNNEMKNFKVSLDFDFFTKFIDFDFESKYKVNNKKFQLVISDYKFYNEIFYPSGLSFENLFFLDIDISFKETIAKRDLWPLKCEISDILNNISKYMKNDINTNIYSNVEILLTDILSKKYPILKIKCEKTNEKEIRDNVIKNISESDNIFALKNEKLCFEMNYYTERRFENTTMMLLSCLHDIYVSLKMADEIVFKEEEPITIDYIKAILCNNFEYGKTISLLRKKCNMSRNDENFDVTFYFNRYAQEIVKLNKMYKHNECTKKAYYELLALFMKERDKQYLNNITIIEANDEKIIQKYMNDNKMNLSNGIEFKCFKLINNKLYLKYKNKLLKNNVSSVEDFEFESNLQKKESVRWANSIKNRVYYYENIMNILFLYMYGLGLYAINKNNIDMTSLDANSIKCYSSASYKEYELNKSNCEKKLIELNELKKIKLIQLDKCPTEKGKNNILKIVNEIELDIQKIINFLNAEIINSHGINMRRCNKENVLRILRNTFSHPERIVLENFSKSNIKLYDYNDYNELVAIIDCNIKELINIFNLEIIFRKNIDEKGDSINL